LNHLLSMTGFGRGEAVLEDLHVAAEVKTVNNRYLEISTKISPTLYDFELRAKEVLRKYLERGKVYLTITDISPRTKLEAVRLDEELTRTLLEHLNGLSAKLGLQEKLTLRDIIPFAEQLQQNSFISAPEELAETAEKALETALINLTGMRKAEGNALREDFLMRLEMLEKGLKQCGSYAEGNTSRRLSKLHDRLQVLLGMKDLDPYRLEMESVLLADRLDITEEVVRMQSHCQQFRKIVEEGGPCGRRLGFLVQEMNRELNTASAKADLPELSHLVVEMKEELEKIREQAQNVE
jgi:uncharacterized protein (TIGR00255 family)